MVEESRPLPRRILAVRTAPPLLLAVSIGCGGAPTVSARSPYPPDAVSLAAEAGPAPPIGPRERVEARSAPVTPVVVKAREEPPDTGAPPPLSGPPPTRFAMALVELPASLVLAAGADQAWAKGPPALARQGFEPLVVRRDVDEAVLPPEMAAWKDRSVELFDARGAACQGRVTRLALIARCFPARDTIASWRGADGYGGPMSPADIAAEGCAETTSLLTAEVTPQAGRGCGGALWGRVAEGEPSPVASTRRPSRDEFDAVMGAVRSTAAYQRIQADHDALSELPRGPWEFSPRSKGPSLEVFELSGAPSLVAVHLPPSPALGQSLDLMVELTEETVDVVADRRVPFFTSAADVDGDGSLELLGPESITPRAGPAFGDTISIRVFRDEPGC